MYKIIGIRENTLQENVSISQGPNSFSIICTRIYEY